MSTFGVAMPGALDGLTVLDLSQIMAGPFCAMLLGDIGADVIKVESPHGGDLSREMDPRVNDETSGAFLTINRNKRSIVLDLKSSAGLEAFYKLVERADVVLQNFRPGVAARLGIDYDTLSARNPGLVYCAVSGFGQDGPYATKAGLDLIAQGMSGIMSVTGLPGGDPVKCGIPVTDLGAGLFATYGVLAALLARERTGVGQSVDVSLFSAGLGLCVWETTQYFFTGTTPVPTGSAHRLGAPYQAFRAKDGYVTVGAESEKHWPLFCQVIGRPELATDPLYATNAQRMRNLEQLQQAVEQELLKADRAHWLALLEAAGVPAGSINTIPEALSDPQTVALGLVKELEQAEVGGMKTVGPVVNMSNTPATIRRPAPRLGEHSREILADLGYDEDERRVLGVEAAR